MAFSQKLVVIGSSSGGPKILRQLLTELPVVDACILIVQHMPKYINESVRKSLEKVTEMDVRLVKDGDSLKDNTIFLAPSEVHTVLENNRKLKLVEGEKVNFVRPSIDLTMQSLKSRPRLLTIGAILTGMGKDGAEGIRHIKRLEGKTIAQNEQTSIIYGMPHAAIKTGDIDYVLDPQGAARKIAELLESNCKQVESGRNAPTSMAG